MPHSFVASVFHIIFSTKERMQLIRAELQPRLWNYLAAVARNHGIHVLAVGGTENHVHILLIVPPEARLSDVVRTLKCNSSRWLSDQIRWFAWQEGYGAFSVSPSQISRVRQYIAKQAEHHSRRSFDDEFLTILKSAKMRLEGEGCRP